MKHSAIMSWSFIKPRNIPNQAVWQSQILKFYRMDPFMTIVYQALVNWFRSAYLHYSTVNKAKAVSQQCTFFVYDIAYSFKISRKNIGSMIANDNGVECNYNQTYDYK